MSIILLDKKIILLVGMMGCGKTSLGRLLSKKLSLPFVDSDKEIEKASGCSISDLFATYGELEFRKGEERVMERLMMRETAFVLSSGGGAFLSNKTRSVAKKYVTSIWIRADIDLLSKRTQGRNHRPLVPSADNKRAIERLVGECYPIYQTADLILDTQPEPIQKTLGRLINLLEQNHMIEFKESE